MKLKHLIITGTYKNLHGAMEFADCGYSVLVGANGSGKSNWIEAVTAVMLHLLESKTPGFEYRLSFDANKEIRYTGGAIHYYTNDTEGGSEGFELPQKLIVCYSGEDHRLWETFMKNSYIEFFKNKTMTAFVEPKTLYVNRYHWAIALVALLCCDDQKVKDLLKEIWGKEIERKDIRIKMDIDEEAQGYKVAELTSILEKIKAEEDLTAMGISSFDIGEEYYTPAYCKKLYYMLYALSMPKAGEEVQMQKAIKSIEIETEGDVNLTKLSEGHKKRILIMLLTRILGDERTVFLFDEPDAHVDVAAKKKIMELIKTANGYVVMTTHSPIMTHWMDPKAVQTVTNGSIDKAEFEKLVTHLSDHQLANVDNFLFTFKRKVVVTEGKFDVFYIRKAISYLRAAHPDLEKFDDVAFTYIGGTGDTKDYLENMLKPVVEYFNRVLILFDNDDAGRGGKTAFDQFVAHENLQAKVKGMLYAENYPDVSGHNFLVEDYFPSTCYVGKPNIDNFTINGYPRFFDMKRMAQQSKTIKTYIENNYNGFLAADYQAFLPLLNEMLVQLGL